MEQFNEQEFKRYMSILKDDRNKNGFGTDYVETNKKLVSSYYRISNPMKKLEIRNKLVMFNIKLAHEILYKKLNVDTSKEDSIDILQEINLCLVESIDKILESKTKGVSTTLYYLIIGSLDKIIKKYYVYNSRKNFRINLEEIIEDEEEEKEDVRAYISTNILKVREYNILREFLNDDISLEEIGYKYGLTRERVRQLRAIAIRRIRDAIETRKRVSRMREENEILRFLRTHPDIKYVIYYPNIEHEFSKSYTNQSLLEKLIYNGIDPKEWLIVDDKPWEYYAKIIGCKKIHHFSESTYYPYHPSDIIYDRNLRAVSESESKLFSMRSYYNFLFKISEFNESGVINTLGRDYVEEFLANDNLLKVYKENLEVNGYQRAIKRDYEERKFYLINCILARRAIIKVYLKKL